MKRRRGANWTPNAKNLPAFLGDEDSETCLHCGKHISRHYGGTEYRCAPIDTRKRKRIVMSLDVVMEGGSLGCILEEITRVLQRNDAKLESIDIEDAKEGR